MPSRFVLLLLVLFLPAAARALDESSQAWKDAVTRYKAGDFAAASEGFRKIAEDEFGALGDTSTLADPAVVDDLIANRQNKKS